MCHRLGAADEAGHVTDNHRCQDHTSIAVDSLYNRLKNVIQYTEFFQHAAHADSKADNGYVLEHASHAAAV